MKNLPLLSAALLLSLLSGCGSGSSNAPQASPVTVTIDWAARSRSLDAPSSAQSAVITLKNALPGSAVPPQDFRFVINRRDVPDAYTQTYTSRYPAKLGTWETSVLFYAQPEGSGSVVGSAGCVMTLKTDSASLPTVATTGAIVSIGVLPGQSVDHRSQRRLLSGDGYGRRSWAAGYARYRIGQQPRRRGYHL